jgi:hypothetical protein
MYEPHSANSCNAVIRIAIKFKANICCKIDAKVFWKEKRNTSEIYGPTRWVQFQEIYLEVTLI